MSETIKIGCVGETGTLKTVQIRYLMDAVGWENVGIISCERGLGPIESDVRESNLRQVNGLDEFDKALEWAAKEFAGKWVCIDGGTRLLEWTANKVFYCTDAAFDAIVIKNLPLNQLKGAAEFGARFITKDQNVDGQAQWRFIGERNSVLLDRGIKGGYNSYWTFWREKTQIDQYRKGLPWMVDAPGTGSRNAVYRALDYIVHLDYDAGHLVGICDTASQVYRCKARNDLRAGVEIAKNMTDFNLAKFIETLKPRVAVAQETA